MRIQSFRPVQPMRPAARPSSDGQSPSPKAPSQGASGSFWNKFWGWLRGLFPASPPQNQPKNQGLKETQTMQPAAGTPGKITVGLPDGKLTAEATAQGHVGQGTLSGLASYQQAQGKLRAQLDYRDETTLAEIHYEREKEQQIFGATLEKQFDHSTLDLSGAVTRTPQGQGEQFQGTWKTDPVGETIHGYQVHGEASAGILKLPGQALSTYASGKIVGTKENSAFFLGVEHQAGPMFPRPETSIQAGWSTRF